MYEHRLGVVDYVVMIGLVLACTVLGLYYSWKFKKQLKNVEGYLLANRSMTIVPAAFSILATKLSGLSVAGSTGEEYLYGPMYSVIFIGYCVGQLIVAVFVVPVFRRGNYISMYEYLERRFNKSVRYTFSLLYLISNLFYVGVVLYIPAVSVTALTGVPFGATLIIMGVTCTLYCVTGGYTSVVYTDVLQTLVMLFAFVLVIVKGTLDAGGPFRVVQDGIDTGFMSAFSFVESRTLRYSVWSTFAAGIQSSFRDLCISQAGMQRLLSVKTTRAAQISTIMSAALGIVFMIFLTASSTVMYVNMHDCDPLLRKNITGVTTPDQIYVYGLAKILGAIPGLTGIGLSGILSGAISSFSSHINAFAAITLEDYLKPMLRPSLLTEKKQVIICMILTGLYGVLATVFAFLVPYLGGAVKASISTVSTISGPLAGAIFMAIFVRRYNTKACYVGMLSSLAFCIFLQVCSAWSTFRFQTLPISTDKCPEDNNTFVNATLLPEVFSAINNATSTSGIETDFTRSFTSFFTISFMWYGPIGVLISMAVGYIVTLFSDHQAVDPSLMYTNSDFGYSETQKESNQPVTIPLIEQNGIKKQDV